MNARRCRSSVLAGMRIMLAAWACLVVIGVQAHEPVSSPHIVSGLGRLDFPTSTHSAQAQAAFDRGMLLLHVFEYSQAQDAFARAEKLDPNFAMAYWGEAMTANHSLWNYQNLEQGRATLARLGATPAARAAKAGSARERAYLAALDVLYGEGTRAERNRRYAEAMAKLAAAYPHDDEAKLFYALALLGRSGAVRDEPTYLQAAKIAQDVFHRNPQHPGAAHYWIHGMDDPEHAAGALEAARALSKIAPDAGHAQHMTSHIFIALGQWDDLVAANENAQRVANAPLIAAGKPHYDCGHYPEWLEYGYFQQGRAHDAQALLQRCAAQGQAAVAWMQAHPGQELNYYTKVEVLQKRLNGTLATMQGTAVVEDAVHALSAAALPVGREGRGVNVGWDDFTQGWAAAERGDWIAVAAQRDAIQALAKAPVEKDGEPSTPTYLSIMARMLDARFQQQTGNTEAAVALARAAAADYDALPFDYGPPVPVKPPHELAGDLLLQAGHGAEAADEYSLALKLAPRRALSLLGRARALKLAGDAEGAHADYATLASIWANADTDLPALAEVRAGAAP